TIDLVFTGTDNNGMPFFTRAQLGARGGGARGDRDGADSGGVVHSTNQSIANIETMERRNPILYLYHRYRQDSGGAGKYRGGNSTEVAFKLHGAREAQAIVWYLDRDVPNPGLNGGEPGATAQTWLKHDTDINSLLKTEMPDFEKIKAVGDTELLPCQNPPMVITDRDVFSLLEPAGGGFGDPLERDQKQVFHDLKEGHISPKKAIEAYKITHNSQA
ncbi:MAG: hydantoinase B/oxoprolinase family protein, partial [Chloroflexota bacterium]